MPKWLLAVLASGALQAAIIRGVVVENQTGRPLARAQVRLQPVAGTAGNPLAVRTNSSGVFQFPPLSAGAYLVTASRRSFAPQQYGQKRWKAAGVPVVLAESGTADLNFHLSRFGAISGTVVDENDVGMPEHDVMAYRNTRPPQMVAKASTDERGVFRLSGLEPGSYLVRTAPKRYDDDSYLPTFSREVLTVDGAQTMDVALDRETEQVKVRPIPGLLYVLGGVAATYPQSPVSVTLVSDAGSQTVTADNAGRFRFSPAAPGRYELFAQGASDRRRGIEAQSAYIPVYLDRDRTDMRVHLGDPSDVQVTVEDTQGQPVDPALYQLKARRKTFAADFDPSILRPNQGHVQLLPGRWDLALSPTPSYYVAAFSGPVSEGSARGRADGWNEILADEPKVAVKFVLSPTPGIVHGAVTLADGRPAPAAPVYLEAFDPNTRRRLTDLRIATTDLKGQYQFYGLPPGMYRILSTFEYEAPDAAAMDAARATVVQIEESKDISQNLLLYTLP